MRPAVKLRSLTTEEEAEIRRLAGSRKEPHRLVQRAKVIEAMLDDPKLYAIQRVSRLVLFGVQSGVTGSSGSTKRAWRDWKTNRNLAVHRPTTKKCAAP